MFEPVVVWGGDWVVVTITADDGLEVTGGGSLWLKITITAAIRKTPVTAIMLKTRLSIQLPLNIICPSIIPNILAVYPLKH